MELSKILTEAEMSQLSPEIVGKIESAYRSELASAIESDSSKQRKQVEKMLECVMQRADKMIGEAVAESVEKYKSNAINDKMYKVLKAVSSCLESAGISFSEELADAKRERKADEQRLKEAYQALNKSKQRENELEKKNFILSQVNGMKPDEVQKVLNQFMKPTVDVRDITKEAIAKFISGDSNDVFMLDIDPDCDGDLNMNNVANALKEINHELDMETKPSSPNKVESRFESLGKGLQPQRSTLPTGNVNLEALESGCSDDSDVAEAMAQLKDFAGIGTGKFA
jgi:hypothetical protein